MGLLESALDIIKDKAIDAAKDKAKDKAMDYAESKIVGERDENEKSSCLGSMFRFVFTLVWLFVVLGVDIASFIVFNPLIGAVIEFVLFLITMIIPYLRKKGSYTRYWGWLALLSAISLIGIAFGR